jgi:hypothetical protein
MEADIIKSDPAHADDYNYKKSRGLVSIAFPRPQGKAKQGNPFVTCQEISAVPSMSPVTG